MIDYEKIAAAVHHYETKGYKEIEVPWIISLDSMLITRPKGARLFSTFAGELVASGEQSFLEIRNQLKPGKYQCVTPCFRDEQIKDRLHHQHFMKNELIWVLEPWKPNDATYYYMLEVMIKDAKEFFNKYCNAVVVDAPLSNAFNNQDIEINGIEVGSYGYRSYEDFHWIYGTGCAEPRLTMSLNQKK
jgi:seryl-tRNA synthetase